jgi:hypothetical protein
MVNSNGTEKDGSYKFLSIFPFIPANYYGAVGTLLDVQNWNQKSDSYNIRASIINYY